MPCLFNIVEGKVEMYGLKPRLIMTLLSDKDFPFARDFPCGANLLARYTFTNEQLYSLALALEKPFLVPVSFSTILIWE